MTCRKRDLCFKTSNPVIHTRYYLKKNMHVLPSTTRPRSMATFRWMSKSDNGSDQITQYSDLMHLHSVLKSDSTCVGKKWIVASSPQFRISFTWSGRMTMPQDLDVGPKCSAWN